MKIAVIGAGAIGCLVAGYLKDKGEDATLVGRAPAVGAIKKNGLGISGVRGDFKININISESLNYIPDLVILYPLITRLKHVVSIRERFALISLSNATFCESGGHIFGFSLNLLKVTYPNPVCFLAAIPI